MAFGNQIRTNRDHCDIGHLLQRTDDVCAIFRYLTQFHLLLDGLIVQINPFGQHIPRAATGFNGFRTLNGLYQLPHFAVADLHAFLGQALDLFIGHQSHDNANNKE